MGLKILKVSNELLESMFIHGTGMVEVAANPLPADAKIVNVVGEIYRGDEIRRGDTVFLLSSASYPETAPGERHPHVEPPRYRRIERVEASPTDPESWRARTPLL